MTGLSRAVTLPASMGLLEPVQSDIQDAAFSLRRYKPGDHGTAEAENWGAGRGLPVLVLPQQRQGRRNDGAGDDAALDSPISMVGFMIGEEVLAMRRYRYPIDTPA